MRHLLYQQWNENLTLKGCTCFESEVLEYASDPGERSTVLPNLRQYVVQPKKVSIPIARDFALVLYGLDRLQEPL